MTTLKIIFFGTSDFGIPALESLYSKGLLSAVVSTPDKPAGRQLKVQESPVKQWAKAHQIPCFDYPKEDPSALLPALKQLRPDLFIVISFGALLKSDYLTAARLYSLNVHASLLPKYRGASPMQQALLNGDQETGVTVMRMIERLDAGDVLLEKKLSIGDEEDITGLKVRLSVLSAEALMESIDQIECGNTRFTVQEESRASYAKKISKNDGRIDWKLPAKQIHDRIRAFAGWPGSYFFFGGKRIVAGKARLSSQAAAGTPGTVLDTTSADGLRVAAGASESLCFEQLQLEGKKMLPYKEFIKGFTLKNGDILE